MKRDIELGCIIVGVLSLYIGICFFIINSLLVSSISFLTSAFVWLIAWALRVSVKKYSKNKSPTDNQKD